MEQEAGEDSVNSLSGENERKSMDEAGEEVLSTVDTGIVSSEPPEGLDELHWSNFEQEELGVNDSSVQF